MGLACVTTHYYRKNSNLKFLAPGELRAQLDKFAKAKRYEESATRLIPEDHVLRTWMLKAYKVIGELATVRSLLPCLNGPNWHYSILESESSWDAKHDRSGPGFVAIGSAYTFAGVEQFEVTTTFYADGKITMSITVNTVPNFNWQGLFFPQSGKDGSASYLPLNTTIAYELFDIAIKKLIECLKHSDEGTDEAHFQQYWPRICEACTQYRASLVAEDGISDPLYSRKALDAAYNFAAGQIWLPREARLTMYGGRFWSFGKPELKVVNDAHRAILQNMLDAYRVPCDGSLESVAAAFSIHLGILFIQEQLENGNARLISIPNYEPVIVWRDWAYVQCSASKAHWVRTDRLLADITDELFDTKKQLSLPLKTALAELVSQLQST